MRRKSVGIRVLKNRLSAYLRAVSEKGQEVVITDRGRPVARLVPERSSVAPTHVPMRVRPAKLDMSDLSWMLSRPRKGGRRAADDEIREALEFTRKDKLFP